MGTIASDGNSNHDSKESSVASSDNSGVHSFFDRSQLKHRKSMPSNLMRPDFDYSSSSKADDDETSSDLGNFKNAEWLVFVYGPVSFMMNNVSNVLCLRYRRLLTSDRCYMKVRVLFSFCFHNNFLFAKQLGTSTAKLSFCLLENSLQFESFQFFLNVNER